jgi:hypothetical protein
LRPQSRSTRQYASASARTRCKRSMVLWVRLALRPRARDRLPFLHSTLVHVGDNWSRPAGAGRAQ